MVALFEIREWVLSVNMIKNLSKRKKIQLIAWISIIFVLVLAGYFYLQHEAAYPSTNDAYVKAKIVHVAAQVRGPVAAVYIKNNQLVKKGQLLFTIDPRPYQLALQEAQAGLELSKQMVAAEESAVQSAKAQVAIRRAQYIKVKENAARILPLVKTGTISKSTGDNTTAAVRAALGSLSAAQAKLQQAQQHLGIVGANNANILKAKAALGNAQLNLQYTKVYAVEDGYITNFNLHTGSMITAYQPLFVLVENKVWWITANFKETDLARIHPGEPVNIVLDMYPHQTFHGVVQSISPGSGAAFSLLPPENASGNWVKVTQRFPVKIIVSKDPSQYPLRVGASSSITVNTLVTKQAIPTKTITIYPKTTRIHKKAHV